MKNIVIIPVRGGSKRLPNKNGKLLGGIPLFVHSINYAKQNLDICHKIVVSTDDAMLKEIALKEGVFVVDRPKELSGDFVPTKDVLKHALAQETTAYNAVILLQSTNPFRPKELLKDAFAVFLKEASDSLMTVSISDKKLGKIVLNKFIPFNYEFGQRSQDMDSLFYENGLLYITKASNIENGEIIGANNYPYIENHPLAKIDIDTQEDFELAAYYYQQYKTNNKQ
jgi:CMP-N-acetylneuraminic acid synthetase